MPLLIILLACGSVACDFQPTGAPAASPSAALPPATPRPTPLPTWTPIPTPRPGGLYVDAAASQGPVSRLSYGSNCGPWGMVPLDVMPQYEASGLTLLRFPGGNWGDQNDLEEYQVDQFIALARKIHAEPLICVRLEKGTPEKAAALVKYARDKGYGVRYWGIGNEPNLYASRDPSYDTVRLNREWRQFAQAMEAVDPAIQLVGPATNQFTGDPAVDPKDSAGRDWLREFLRANGDMVDVVAVHRYPFPRSQVDGPPSVDELLADAPRWDDIVRNLRAAVRETTGRDLPIAFTEFNSSWASQTGAETTTDSFYSALWLGDVLGRLIRQRVDMIVHFALQSSPRLGGFGLLGTYEVRPAYYVYQMYKGFGSELVYASSDQPMLSIYAARRADGALTLMAVNRGPQAMTQRVTLAGFAPAGRAEVRLFDPTHNAETRPAVDVSADFQYTFPPTSMTLLTIPPK